MIDKLIKSLKSISMPAISTVVLGSILLLLSFFVYRIIMKVKQESFTIVDMLIPPLKQESSIEYGYVCPVNGYRCKPKLVYKIVLSGNGKYADMRFQKYKIIDDENLVRYSGLYQSDDLPIGSYIVFDNGQEYVLTSFDVTSEPMDCPPVRRELKE